MYSENDVACSDEAFGESGFNLYILTTPDGEALEYPPWNLNSKWCSLWSTDNDIRLKNYWDAQTECQNRGQVLMSISNQEQQDLFFVSSI